MSERESNQQSDRDPYSGVHFAVYDASDFYPRGSLQPRSKINPPYRISKAPSNLKSIKDILDTVSRVNPQSNLKRDVERLADWKSDVNYSNIKTRTEPERVCEKINLNYLRDLFKTKTTIANNEDIFRKGDKIAIIWPDDSSYHVLVDLKRGEQRYIWGKRIDEEFIKKYTNEKEKHGNVTKHFEHSVYDKAETSFENIDLELPILLEAEDVGERKIYPKETLHFFNRMRQADLEVENLLVNSMDRVVPVSESLKRLSRRKGRQYVRGCLARARSGDLESLIDEITVDMHYEHKWNRDKKTLNRKETQVGLNLLLRAEKYYLNAILDFPWNKIGPEPFDTLIDVFWFRFNFAGLQNNWKFRTEHIKSIRSDEYARAQAQRILRWVWEHRGYSFEYLKDLKESNIKYKAKRVAKDMGPLHKFLNKRMLDERIINASLRSRPSGLTLLLWKTLKWASPSEWKDGDAMMTSDFRYEDPEIWDEHFPDPYWVNHGDFQGRLVLAGETLLQPLSHLRADGSAENQIRKSLCYSAEQEEIELGVDGNKELIEKATFQRLREADRLNYHEWIAKGFQDTVSNLSIKELDGKIRKMSSLQKVIALHRLGYSCSVKLRDDLGRINWISKDSSVRNVISTFFNGKPDRYYKVVKQLTKIMNTN